MGEELSSHPRPSGTHSPAIALGCQLQTSPWRPSKLWLPHWDRSSYLQLADHPASCLFTFTASRALGPSERRREAPRQTPGSGRGGQPAFGHLLWDTTQVFASAKLEINSTT